MATSMTRSDNPWYVTSASKREAVSKPNGSGRSADSRRA
jgi:hypothetical protein